MEAVGMPEDEHELSGCRVRLANGSVRLPDGTLAGSALTMDQAMRNGVTFMGIPMKDIVRRMPSETLADIPGMFEKGRITVGGRCRSDGPQHGGYGRVDHRGWRDRLRREG
jgi:N-acetylglucosamine-6-phosphate deacetylase